MTIDIRQFKLTNDEEIICEVVSWNDEDNDAMVVRRALRIIAVDDTSASMRYYTFKPWMLMNNDPDSMQVLNSYHIISESKPAKVAVEHYYDVLKDMKDEPFEYEAFSNDSDARAISEMINDDGTVH